MSATPRPWQVSAHGGNVLGPLAEVIARVWFPDRTVGQANAALIVRAVNAHDDLLAALNGLVAAEDRYTRETGLQADDPITEAVAVARLAILKAEGRPTEPIKPILFPVDPNPKPGEPL